MLTLLEDVLKRADGSYVANEDLGLLDQTLSTWENRKRAYKAVEQKEEQIIEAALTAMRKGDRFVKKPMNELGVDRCRRDMTLGLRCCALAMLLEDENLLKDRVLYWQRNIFLAMQLNYQGYKFLGQAIQANLPKAQSALLVPYFESAHQMMTGN